MAGRPARRPGIAHLGVGAFARAHLAWYTQRAPGEWGIVAFTGRSPAAADALRSQDCRYTLVTRSGDGDEALAMDVIVSAHDGADRAVWRDVVASPTTAIVTMTVTEAGYAPGSDVITRLVDGLRARAAADGGPITLMSLDNLTSNGHVLRAAVLDAADEPLAAWIAEHVTFPSSMVDRITPATTDDDVAAVRDLQGAVSGDRIPVITEPFAEWVITDDFAGDRPAWEQAGARVVPDVGPYEQRKLWLLNGSHSLLAYLGPLLGHETVAEAIGDPRCRAAVEQLWDEAQAELPLPAAEVEAARRDLVDRFENPRIRHTLRQIASDGSGKLPVRIVDPLRRRLDRGGSIGPGAATALAAWWLHLTTQPDLVRDAGAPGPDATVRDALAVVAPDLVTDALADAVSAAADRIRALLPTQPRTQGASA